MAITYPDLLDDDADYAVDELPDLHGRLPRLRERAPAAWVRCFGRPAVMFTSYELVNAAFKDEETFPSAAFYGNTVTDVLGPEPPVHVRRRAQAQPRARVARVPPAAHARTRRAAARAGGATSSSTASSRAAKPTSSPSSRRATRSRSSCGCSACPRRRGARSRAGRSACSTSSRTTSYAVRCSQEFTAFVDPILHERRDDPADDLISTLATDEVDGDRLTDDEIMNFLKLLFPAGADTTYLGLGNTLFALLTPSRSAGAGRRRPRGPGRAAAAEEGLRWNAPVRAPARATTRTTSSGTTSRSRPTRRCSSRIAAANRDPAVFADPDRFDIDRRPGATLTFGFGTHFCLGAHLARAELDICLQVLAERLRGCASPTTRATSRSRAPSRSCSRPEPAPGAVRLAGHVRAGASRRR